MMDKQSNSTSVPKNSSVQRDRFAVHHTSVKRLQHMTIYELLAFFEALRHAEEALGGFLNQPRFSVGKSSYNAAGKAVESLSLHLMQCIDDAVEVARTAIATDRDDVECRAKLLLRYEAYVVDSFDEFAALAAEQALAVSQAEVA